MRLVFFVGLCILRRTTGQDPDDGCERSGEGIVITDTPECLTIMIEEEIGVLEANLANLYSQVNLTAPFYCRMTNAGNFAIKEITDGYQIVNKTDNNEQPLNRMKLYLAPEQESEVLVPGLAVRVKWDSFDNLEIEEEPKGLFGNIKDSALGFWGAVGSNMVGLLFFCIVIGVMLGLEGKFQCIGGGKIHEIMNDQKKMSAQVHEVIDMLGLAKGVGEQGMIDDPDNPGQKMKNPEFNPLENPLVVAGLQKGLGAAGITGKEQAMLMSIMKLLHTDPKQVFAKMEGSGLVPKQFTEMKGKVGSEIDAHKDEVKAKVQAGTNRVKSEVNSQIDLHKDDVKAKVKSGATKVKDGVVKEAKGMCMPQVSVSGGGK
jgi:hypothetical protein